MSATYQLSPSAKEDLDGIIDYTLENFGTNQARKYIAALEKCAERLASGQIARSLPKVHPDIRFTKCEHHYIFGFPQNDEPFYIIAILHEKMDMLNHLEVRL